MQGKSLFFPRLVVLRHWKVPAMLLNREETGKLTKVAIGPEQDNERKVPRQELAELQFLQVSAWSWVIPTDNQNLPNSAFHGSIRTYADQELVPCFCTLRAADRFELGQSHLQPRILLLLKNQVISDSESHPIAAINHLQRLPPVSGTYQHMDLSAWQVQR